MAATQSTEIQTVPQSKSSMWKLANALGGLKTTLACQRRQSTRLITDMVSGFEHVLDVEDNILAVTLNWFEKATHINRRYLFAGAILFAVSYLSMGRNAGTLCNILGMMYPIYASIKATENMDGHTKEHWLTYWIVYSTVNFLEVLLEIFLVWLPLYYLIKFVFLSWCMVPIAANGSNVIYGSIIRPLFHQHSEKVDSALSAMTQQLTEISKEESTDQEVRQRQVNGEAKEE